MGGGARDCDVCGEYGEHYNGCGSCGTTICDDCVDEAMPGCDSPDHIAVEGGSEQMCKECDLEKMPCCGAFVCDTCAEEEDAEDDEKPTSKTMRPCGHNCCKCCVGAECRICPPPEKSRIASDLKRVDKMIRDKNTSDSLKAVLETWKKSAGGGKASSAAAAVGGAGLAPPSAAAAATAAAPIPAAHPGAQTRASSSKEPAAKRKAAGGRGGEGGKKI